MSLSITDLLTSMTSDQVFDQFVANCEALGVPASKWRKGGVARTILRVCAIAFSMFTVLVVAATGSAWLETSSGAWLRLLARSVYGVIAREATFASGVLTLTNAGGGVYTYGAREATFLDTKTKKTYVNSAPFSLGALTSLDVDIIATEAGSASSAPPSEIDALVTVMTGVTCLNAAAVVGLDAISDPDLRQQCLDRLGAMSVRGVRTAYRYAVSVALNAGVPVNINRVSITRSSHTGVVSVVVASPSGTPSAGDVTACADSIEAIARPEAVTSNTTGASAVAYTASLTIWARSAPGLVASHVKTLVDARLIDFFKNYDIGGLKQGTSAPGVYASGVDAAVGDAHPSIFSVQGAIDLPLAAGQVATDSVTTTVRLVSGAST